MPGSTGVKRVRTNTDSAAKLRAEILKELPDGAVWLLTPHPLLGGDTPEQRIQAGDVQAVADLLRSILYIGMM